MLQPNNDRLDYGKLLMPPEGYQLDNAIATTYSLDLEALVSIPVALYLAHSLDVNIKQDMVQVLDSIRRASTSIKVFCQKGQIKVPDNQHRLFHFIESCIVQVPPTQKSSFHPKIWVIRFRNNEKEVKYRVIVLSRNLTFDRSWDVAFQMEGTSNYQRQNNFRNTKPLVDFINYLGEYERPNWLKTFLVDLGKTEFKITANEFEDFTFLPTGFDGYRSNVLFDDNVYDESLIVSPFLANGALDLASKHSNTKPYLFSREIELRKTSQEMLSRFRCYHLMNDYVEGEEKTESDTEENGSAQLQDLHAKVYSYKDGWNAFLLLGSANCSTRAIESNVEFMIKLTGKNSKIGPQAIFKELVNDELKVFQHYASSEQLTANEELIASQEQELQKTKIDLVNAKLKAKAIKQDDDNYKIDIDYDLGKIVTGTIEAKTYLFSSNQEQSLRFGVMNSWSVHNLSELDLSSFLVVELKLKGHPIELKFALKIEIADLPETRSARIFRDIISNSANFFKYIRFLLAENYWDEALAFAKENGKQSGGVLDAYFEYEEPIYESMLKAISRDPEKLEEIRRIMDKLSEEEDGKEPIIPKDFRELWSVFEEAKKAR